MNAQSANPPQNEYSSSPLSLISSSSPRPLDPSPHPPLRPFTIAARHLPTTSKSPSSPTCLRSLSARLGRPECCGPIMEDSVGRGETDDTLQKPGHVIKAA